MPVLVDVSAKWGNCSPSTTATRICTSQVSKSRPGAPILLWSTFPNHAVTVLGVRQGHQGRYATAVLQLLYPETIALMWLFPYIKATI
jgi:hypothetical protein